MTTRTLRAATMAIALAVVAVPSAAPILRASISAPDTLAQLQGMAELKSWFNGYKGHPRLIFLLSPT